MSHLSVMIKPVGGSCNMRCRYCFYLDEMSNRETDITGYMSKKTAKHIIAKLIDKASVLSIVFQGGEPTLWGIDNFKYFTKTVNEINTKKIPVYYSLQTNGTLIDENWCAFLKQNNFLVGVSLDGPRDIQDIHRKDVKGNSKYEKTMLGISLLKSNDVDLNILVTVNKDVAKNIKRIYEFFKKNNLNYQQYIPCIDPIGECNVKDYSLDANLFGEFLISLFELWKKDILGGKYVYIRYFENLVNILAGEKPELCGMLGCCTKQYVFESNGSVYPCDFYALDDYMIGNILSDSIDDIDEKRKDLEFLEKSSTIHDDCKSCEYFILCKGGCRRERDDFEESMLQKNKFCVGYKMFFKHAISDMSLITKLATEDRLQFK